MTFRSQARWTVTVNLAAILCAQSVSAIGVLAVKPKSFDDNWVWVAIVGGGLLIAATAIDACLAKIRSGKIQTFARPLGLSFRRQATEADAVLPNGCSLATLGQRTEVLNILEAVQTPEFAFTLFDYEYNRGRQTRQQTISRMQSSLLHLPSFVLFPKTIFSKLRDNSMGPKDIDLSDSPVFSETFVLRGEDEPAIRALFSAKLRQALEATPDFTIEGTVDRLFIFRGNYRLKPEEFFAAIDQGKKILALFFEAQPSAATAS